MKEAIVGEQFQQLAVFDYNPVNSFKVLLFLFPVNNWLC
jgi:hypothetical protein